MFAGTVAENIRYGNLAQVMVALTQALTLAEPEGFVRLFVDEGPPAAELLEKLNTSRESGTQSVKE